MTSQGCPIATAVKIRIFDPVALWTSASKGRNCPPLFKSLLGGGMNRALPIIFALFALFTAALSTSAVAKDPTTPPVLLEPALFPNWNGLYIGGNGGGGDANAHWQYQ